ncbi:hypothetical protein SAMN05192583_2049 [Sphingomonas gellani]|uniref:CDP-Glycerol:Poly(Glycerophosphate) glycerophosphotransferase n=1 Tax=Sphingomonas gellani TaxID=1166340 RepID=A0A1H8DTH8_9SPHN|nr:hypothetical protein [Sphingomonas gellani]SEN10476.1 hypothetical protein SAMN05192583_2049 [Sphingomonas gellani]
MRVGFLYNHDAVHQVRHTAPVAAALAGQAGVEVVVLSSTPDQEREVRALIGPAAARVRFVALEPGALAGALDRALRFVSPFRRLAVLRRNLSAFADLDVLVVPETTSILLRERFGLDRLRFVWIPHGAGDRSVGFLPVARSFDLVLLAGDKVRDRMIAMGLVTPESSAVVGYPKFDTVDPAQALPSPFANDRPTVLYNPHFDPRLSSWYRMGPQLLRWFADQRAFNLIFAPHVMLFQRRFHASMEHRGVRWRADVPSGVRGLPHMLVDTGSDRLSDMSYTRAADIYLGDVSSQIYEWIARPRPAIFLNAGGLSWRDDPDFAHWELGQVIDSVDALPGALDRAVAEPARHRVQQDAAFAGTFSRTGVSAARRAADAIVDHFAA